MTLLAEAFQRLFFTTFKVQTPHMLPAPSHSPQANSRPPFLHCSHTKLLFLISSSLLPVPPHLPIYGSLAEKIPLSNPSGTLPQLPSCLAHLNPMS